MRRQVVINWPQKSVLTIASSSRVDTLTCTEVWDLVPTERAADVGFTRY